MHGFGNLVFCPELCLKPATERRARILALIVSIFVSLVASEGLLRLLGYEPWTYLTLDRNEPVMFEYDSSLGWRTKEGHFEIPPYDPSGSKTALTILKSGVRKSSEHQTEAMDSRPKMIFVGCSFTQGWAINDDETFPWKIQQKLPSFEVMNYGAGGYGTYQSLLLLERMLPAMAEPKIIIYGFIDHHEDRNVATGQWLELLAGFSRRAHVYVPSVGMDKTGNLRRQKPGKYPELPFREDLATAALAEKAMVKIRTLGREKQKRKLTQQLMLEMKRLSARYGAQFAVALFDYDAEARASYMNFFGNNGIGAIDCFVPRRNDLIVSGEGHPNGRMNSLWAECIADYLRQNLR